MTEVKKTVTIEESQDLAAREWNEAFDYRALRNGVQVGNIKMLHLDGVNKRAIEIYSQQVNAELLQCLERALNDIQHLKGLALNGMPGEFTLGMCRRMDDYEAAIKRARGL